MTTRDLTSNIDVQSSIDPDDYTVNNAGRPIPVLPDGEPNSELI